MTTTPLHIGMTTFNALIAVARLVCRGQGCGVDGGVDGRHLTVRQSLAVQPCSRQQELNMGGLATYGCFAQA